MKISLSWLRDYIDLDHSIQVIADMLTGLGLEVEGIDTVQSVPGGLAGLVIGHVISCEKHPNADKLSLTKVNIGDEEAVQIVCGAPNVAAGQKVVVAPVGSTIYPVEGEPWKIKKGKIRGELSLGMICAEDEIGLGTSHDGIMVLDSDAPIGAAVAEYFDIKEDTVFDIGLTPNRSDATSHIGVARDLSAYIQINHDPKVLKLPDVPALEEFQESVQFEVSVENTDDCPRFSGVLLSNVKVGSSPKWMQERLIAIGVRPINNIVDVTNYVLHEYGQPLHAYDADKIANDQILVKTLGDPSKFTTLDGVERTMSANDIMICDGASQGLCIAGVFGGERSGVTADTTRIFLESAHFNASKVRQTSMAHQLRTDAAMVFEKGSDPNVTVTALTRAVDLLAEYADAQQASNLIDIYPVPVQPAKVRLSYDHVRHLIGVDMSSSQIKDILSAMDIEIQDVTDSGLTAIIPTNKVDVTRECDVIEEILRIYGFNNVPTSPTIKSTISYTDGLDKFSWLSNTKQFLSGKGWHEMMNMSITQSKYYLDSLPSFEDDLVYINNTSNIHLDVMRPEMMIPALQTVAHNHNRQQRSLQLYEIGKSYQNTEGSYNEQEYLVLISSTDDQSKSWLSDSDADGDSFFGIKRVVLELLYSSGVTDWSSSEITEDERFAFGLSLAIGNRAIARFGRVSTDLAQSMGIKSEVSYAELSIASIMAAAERTSFKTRTISKYPSVSRDLALVMDEQVAYADIQRMAQQRGGKSLQSVKLFDIYKNEEVLGKGKKSYAINLTLEDENKTLKDKDVDKIIKKILHGLEQDLGAVLR